MKKILARLSAFWILCLVIFSSCQKEELISSEIIREFQIDTIFYEKLDPAPLVFSDHRVHGIPVLTDEHIFFSASQDSNFRFIKADLSTGEILWTWSSFQSGDLGHPRKIVHQQDKVLFVTSDFAYVLNARTAQMLFVYSPKQNDQLEGATLFNGQLLASITNPNDGARLDEIALDGTGATSLKTLDKTDDFDPVALDLELIHFQNAAHIAWQVMNAGSGYADNVLYYSPDGNTGSFHQLSLGSGSYEGEAKPAFLLPGSIRENWLYAVTNSGVTGAYDLHQSDDPIRWLRKLPWGRELLQNSECIYALSNIRSTEVARDFVSVYSKISGLTLSTGVIPRVEAVTNNFLLGSYENTLRIYDSETLQELQVFESSSEIKGMFQLNENEFFFSDFNGEGYIGRLRITPLNQ